MKPVQLELLLGSESHYDQENGSECMRLDSF